MYKIELTSTAPHIAVSETKPITREQTKVDKPNKDINLQHDRPKNKVNEQRRNQRTRIFLDHATFLRVYTNSTPETLDRLNCTHHLTLSQ